MFCAVISQIGNSGRPIVTELIIRIPEADPVEAHVHGVGAFGNNGIVCDPRIFELSIWRYDLGWEQHILMIFWWRGIICLAVMKRAASSNLDAEDMTNLIIWEILSSGLLLDGMGTSLERKMSSPDWLRAFLSLRKDAL